LAVVVVLVGCLGVVPATAAAASYGPQQTLPFTACTAYVTTNCLTNPYGVAVDASGDVIVLNSYNNQVWELTPGADGSLSDGTQTTLPFTGLGYPNAVAVDASGDVFVSNAETDDVLELSPGADGSLSDGTQTTVPFFTCATSSSINCLSDPTGVAVNAAGDVFVVSSENSEILRLSPGAHGFSDGDQQTLPFVDLDAPQGVAVDASGDVFVTDGQATTNLPGGGLIELSPEAGTDKFEETAYVTNPFPQGVAVDPSGNVFVTSESSQIVEYSPGSDGTLTGGARTTLPFSFQGDAELVSPEGVATDAYGDVFLADTFNDQVLVLPSVVASLSISPAGQRVVPGDTADFSAEGFDASNNDLGDETADTKFSITPDGSGSATGASCLANGCLATVAGTYTVTGRYGLASGSTTITVVAGMPTSLTLSPDVATVTPGTSQIYHSEGFDAYGNDAGDLTAVTSFTIAPSGGTGSQTGASCNGDVCSATTPGTYIVSAVDTQHEIATGQAELVVAPVASLSLSPRAATVAAGAAQAYSAEGFDAQSVDLGSVTGATTFSIAPDGSGSQPGASCTGDSCSASSPGTYTVTGTYPVPGTDGSVTGTAKLTVTAVGTSTSVLEINEVRLTGPAAAPADVYVDLYNSSGAPVSISGWSLGWKTASGVTGTTALADSSLAGGMIPAGGHYLLADDSSYSLTAVPDQDLGLPSGSGGLVGVDIEQAGVVSDSVGYVGTSFASETGLTEPVYATDDSSEIAFVRRFSDGQPVDTGDNATDFDLVAPYPDVASYGENTVLGVPSPLDSASPTQVNGIAQSYLLDTGTGETEATAPNLVYETFDSNPVSEGNPAVLIIRRTITNVSSSSTITKLQIRITGLSTWGEQSDPVFGNPSSPSSVAILLPVNSAGGSVSTSSGQATIAATTLQNSLPGDPNIPGGLNSALTVALPLETGSSTEYGLIPGQSVNVAITFYVFRTGSFKFAYNVEDDLKPYTPAATQGAGSPSSTSASGPPVATSLSGSVTQTGAKLTSPPVASSKGSVHRKTHKKRKTRKPAHKHRQRKKRQRAYGHATEDKDTR
jgi:serine/threonine-protein kinase